MTADELRKVKAFVKYVGVSLDSRLSPKRQRISCKIKTFHFLTSPVKKFRSFAARKSILWNLSLSRVQSQLKKLQILQKRELLLCVVIVILIVLNRHPHHHWYPLSGKCFDAFRRSCTSMLLYMVWSWPYTDTSRPPYKLSGCTSRW